MQTIRFCVGLSCVLVTFGVLSFGQNNATPSIPEEKSAAVNHAEKSKLDTEPSASDISAEEWVNLFKPEPSLIHIMAQPDQYHGKKLFVSGFLRLEKEGNAIYLSENDDQHLMRCNAFWVSLENNTTQMSHQELVQEFSGKYVDLQGTFDKDEHGHMDHFQGAFKNITHISTKPDRAYYNQLREKYRRDADNSTPADIKK